jgi:hypothetical protein
MLVRWAELSRGRVQRLLPVPLHCPLRPAAAPPAPQGVAHCSAPLPAAHPHLSEHLRLEAPARQEIEFLQTREKNQTFELENLARQEIDLVSCFVKKIQILF